MTRDEITNATDEQLDAWCADLLPPTADCCIGPSGIEIANPVTGVYEPFRPSVDRNHAAEVWHGLSKGEKEKAAMELYALLHGRELARGEGVGMNHVPAFVGVLGADTCRAVLLAASED